MEQTRLLWMGYVHENSFEGQDAWFGGEIIRKWATRHLDSSTSQALTPPNWLGQIIQTINLQLAEKTYHYWQIYMNHLTYYWYMCPIGKSKFGWNRAGPTQMIEIHLDHATQPRFLYSCVGYYDPGQCFQHDIWRSKAGRSDLLGAGTTVLWHLPSEIVYPGYYSLDLEPVSGSSKHETTTSFIFWAPKVVSKLSSYMYGHLYSY